ncbi:Low-affinity potassium transport protein [Fulvia fulva]|uniref:Potassium transport protein n=1 Tax=Passalora fulva TaxID=5499 RepID=A0A9Q8PB15_PASFU|nr:Low-affinity potassium transport protein [Fulvia fulva]KAK4621802.1 Low-affinity potassium transport protein [Fulvia fulva]KAK4623035.1 Low-affinity potassium transport protein [Fulvia fulva]UJO19177.1 Low-affinity potassium transport protein [Fulvia fulva]WPV15774.1 Low-affinity potassium transport protein [Fulvia fulva]WPV31050.1 Low-affinity potassium transport protein [Fulvia fulva]
MSTTLERPPTSNSRFEEGHPQHTWYHDAFAPIIEVWLWLKSIVPTRLKLKWPKFNFIAVHYGYMIGMTAFFSILLFGNHPKGIGMQYIDALFFAAGAATQSGLNTIDVNNLSTYNQVVIMLGCCLCTPVFINTIVVLVRLYWFEKRFEHIVKEARAVKKSGTISRTKSQMRGDKEKDPGALEVGSVRQKPIEVLKNTLQFSADTSKDPKKQEEARRFREKMGLQASDGSTDATPQESQSGSSSSNTGEPSDSNETIGVPEISVRKASRGMSIEMPPAPIDFERPQTPRTPQSPFMGLNPRLNRDREITFADEVNTGRQSPELARIPEHRDISRHIEFLERQNQKRNEAGALRIPGPRERDAGEDVKQLEEDRELRRLRTNLSNAESARSRSVDAHSEISHDDRPVRRGITIDEPEHPAHRDRNDDDATFTKDDPRAGGLSKRRSNRGFNLSDAPRTLSRSLTQFTNGRKDEDPMPYLSWSATTGRNSAFLGLTQEQREELGGIEYRSLKTLAMILVCYYVGFHTLGMLVFLPWMAAGHYADVVTAADQNPLWWGIFTPASMFNDLGFTLTPDSMVSFQTSVLTLLFGSFLIIIGNTGFPCMLRFIIWFLAKFVASHGSPWWEELRFLLDHPRRCFTLLFPSKATWWLFWVLVGLNVIDLIFFVILDLDEAAVTSLPVGLRILNGWFQAVSTRTAGFASVSLADLHAAIQVSYLIMMYISVFPIAISVRRTNVYEEKSLGIFGGEEDAGDGDQSYVSQHLRRQLSFDLWYIFLGLFIIAIVEGDRIANTNQPAFTTFSVLFEIVSAYGTVGLSLGYPDYTPSFSGQFKTLSKLIIVAMMIRGRHRGLPYALDRAILLPSEKLQQKEAAEAERQMLRRPSTFAEGHHAFTRSKTWEDGELDKWGLPAQHAAADQAMTADSGSDPEHAGLRQTNTGRTNTSQQGGKPHQRVRSLSKAILSGLNPAPTFNSKWD